MVKGPVGRCTCIERDMTLKLAVKIAQMVFIMGSEANIAMRDIDNPAELKSTVGKRTSLIL